jgi:hypothetical protein
LRSYGLPKMNDHKILQAVFVIGNIKGTGRLSQNGRMTTTLSLHTTNKAQVIWHHIYGKISGPVEQLRILRRSVKQACRSPVSDLA